MDSTDSKWLAEVRSLTGKRGVDIVIEHVGGEVLSIGFHLPGPGRRGGHVQRHCSGRQVPLNLWPFSIKQQRLIGSYGRNHADMGATMQWVAEAQACRSFTKYFHWPRLPPLSPPSGIAVCLARSW